MNHSRILFVCITLTTVLLAGCATTLKPNYISNNPDLMRIGGDKPQDKTPEVNNLGTYCLQVTEHWKSGGKTPDGEVIWTKDTFRKAVTCQ